MIPAPQTAIKLFEDKNVNSQSVTKCNQLKMNVTKDGKMRLTDVIFKFDRK